MDITFCGGGSGARKANRSVTFGMFEGEEVAFIELPDGRSVMLSADRARRLQAIGINLGSARLDSDGKGNQYVRLDAWLPDPSRSKAAVRSLARLIICDAEVEGVEFAGLHPIPAKGWTGSCYNRNTLDLRDRNLTVLKAEGRSNTWHDMHDVKRRWKLVAEGKDPESEYAAGRRASRGRSETYAG